MVVVSVGLNIIFLGLTIYAVHWVRKHKKELHHSEKLSAILKEELSKITSNKDQVLELIKIKEDVSRGLGCNVEIKHVDMSNFILWGSENR